MTSFLDESSTSTHFEVLYYSEDRQVTTSFVLSRGCFHFSKIYCKYDVGAHLHLEWLHVETSCGSLNWMYGQWSITILINTSSTSLRSCQNKPDHFNVPGNKILIRKWRCVISGASVVSHFLCIAWDIQVLNFTLTKRLALVAYGNLLCYVWLPVQARG